MEQNKDIADIQAAEATFQKKKKFILCYHSFSVNNFKKASVQIRKLAEAAGSPKSSTSLSRKAMRLCSTVHATAQTSR